MRTILLALVVIIYHGMGCLKASTTCKSTFSPQSSYGRGRIGSKDHDDHGGTLSFVRNGERKGLLVLLLIPP